jgi:hypothetical protein|tara:strand:- start:2502 stop:3011 length:510 start_codon:yes stop_codon:yes gene_type:complete
VSPDLTARTRASTVTREAGFSRKSEWKHETCLDGEAFSAPFCEVDVFKDGVTRKVVGRFGDVDVFKDVVTLKIGRSTRFLSSTSTFANGSAFCRINARTDSTLRAIIATCRGVYPRPSVRNATPGSAVNINCRLAKLFADAATCAGELCFLWECKRKGSFVSLLAVRLA